MKDLVVEKTDNGGLVARFGHKLAHITFIGHSAILDLPPWQDPPVLAYDEIWTLDGELLPIDPKFEVVQHELVPNTGKPAARVFSVVVSIGEEKKALAHSLPDKLDGDKNGKALREAEWWLETLEKLVGGRPSKGGPWVRNASVEDLKAGAESVTATIRDVAEQMLQLTVELAEEDDPAPIRQSLRYMNFIALGAWDEALALLSRWRNAQPKVGRPLLEMAWIFMRVGEADDAEDYLDMLQGVRLSRREKDRLAYLQAALHVRGAREKEALPLLKRAMKNTRFEEDILVDGFFKQAKHAEIRQYLDLDRA